MEGSDTVSTLRPEPSRNSRSGKVLDDKDNSDLSSRVTTKYRISVHLPQVMGTTKKRREREQSVWVVCLKVYGYTTTTNKQIQANGQD